MHLFRTSPTNKGTREVTYTERPRITRIRRTTRISVKPVQGRFARRLAERTAPTPSKNAPKEKVLMVLSSDDEPEANIEKHATKFVGIDEATQGEKEEDPEELPKEEFQDFWNLLEPSTSTSRRGYDEGDDPRFWNYDGDLDDWCNAKPSEGSVGSCTGPPPAAK
ncbi:hypothetical protein PIB30_084170 [Stylosanthes scabra]|uniref:Uncharacterized protein n=1 Tax=Stylosanthes scabra TaxID=79078 RepID=A0ABU6ZR44_9FABA|nr:hypothetical protein [Stylosanthes scabra]